MAQVFLGLGTNMGDKSANLMAAKELLQKKVGKLLKSSLNYVSTPWGFTSENNFLNGVVLMETDLLPFQLLAQTQEIERQIGRTTKSNNGYADRVIDIDILMYDELVLDEPTLKIPHPLMVNRDFVLEPLLEIAPNLVHPQFHKPMSDYYSTGASNA